ncbi:hypothetical protein HHL19_02615 [Streptomyces sp. R302]|uniref:hypothetical protein n=1 Tax=unclassified Streptomyces TaxID=2593676 RepID=UPI00145C65CE|nr:MULTISPECIES: hypothetical protein [unclassified Streptomyces]NML49250.1 hypothetical protein [Streptomyces sp. R301]NML77577.1 hypothetical protein [Streptomyces sp. R302]
MHSIVVVPPPGTAQDERFRLAPGERLRFGRSGDADGRVEAPVPFEFSRVVLPGLRPAPHETEAGRRTNGRFDLVREDDLVVLAGAPARASR